MRKPKEFVSLILFAFLFVLLTLDFSSCTHEDQVLDEFIPLPPPGPSKTELVAKKVAAGPVIDGVIDADWDDAEKLETMVVVPDPGDDVFKGYVGHTNEVTLRALYDDENVYFLAEWTDNYKDHNRQTWYFDPGTKRWAQESRNPVFNADGVMIRRAFYEDKFAFLWNVNNSVANWDATTCWASCHTGLSEADGFARHYTQPGETVDMWHWKSVRTDVNFQSDDQYQNDDQPNGRHGDTKESGGYSNNTQDLVINGTTETVSVPAYFIPGRSYYYWITQAEIDATTAKLITAVDEDGKLYYDGGVIDPVVETGYQRDGSTSGALGMPSIYTKAFVGNRGDLISKGTYTGSGWVLEIQRKLKTLDTEAMDVDFSSLEDLAFGIGVFDNAGISHGIMAGLLMKFEQ